MRIGIPKEARAEQTLVAASPDTVKKLMKLGYDVVMGIFIEEDVSKKVLEHGANWIW